VLYREHVLLKEEVAEFMAFEPVFAHSIDFSGRPMGLRGGEQLTP
jgi:hypothetical protein